MSNTAAIIVLLLMAPIILGGLLYLGAVLADVVSGIIHHLTKPR